MNKSGKAAVMSFLIPGLGQVYNRDFLRGAFWLVVTPGFWIGSGGMAGWACHLASAYTAHKRAEKKAHGVSSQAQPQEAEQFGTPDYA